MSRHASIRSLISQALVGLAVAVTAVNAGCAEELPSEPYADHEELADLEPFDDGKGDGLASFNMNDVYADAFLTDVDSIDAVELQAFFEDSPYGNRSWLANATINGVTAAEAIVAAAQAEGINPLVLVARMQVESSAVSKTAAPTKARQDKALGCGCPDGGGCASQYKGLDKQFSCAAKILRKWYDASIDGTAPFRVGVSKKTLDPKTVTPKTHATASLYMYTPWVLVGRGGTWLVWNVTKKYVKHAVDAGMMDPLP